MKAIEYRTVDKSAWDEGPWTNEPDKRQWQDKATGYPCLIVRNPRMGFLCGYVGVPKGHLAHGLDYNAIEVNVHGGLTFADGCAHGDDESTGVCHKVDLCQCERSNAEQDRKRIHSGNHRRRGLNQPSDPHDQNDEVGPTRDRTEALAAGFQHRQGHDRLAVPDVEARSRDANLPTTQATSQTSIRLEALGRKRGSGAQGGLAVPNNKEAASSAGDRIQARDRAVQKNWRRGNVPQNANARANACSQRQQQAITCVECGKPIGDDVVYWLGFDCGHGGDLAPGIEAMMREARKIIPPLIDIPEEYRLRDVYRDFAYVTAQVEKLAKQMAEIATKP